MRCRLRMVQRLDCLVELGSFACWSWSSHGPLGVMFVHWSRMREQVLGQRNSCGGDLLCVLSGEVVDGVARSACRGMVCASGLRAGQPVGCCGTLGDEATGLLSGWPARVARTTWLAWERPDGATTIRWSGACWDVRMPDGRGLVLERTKRTQQSKRNRSCKREQVGRSNGLCRLG